MSKVIFITGASTGLGRAIAEASLEKGYRVVATARRPEALRDLTEAYGQNVIALKLDVTDRVNVRQAIEEAVSVFGKIDVLINNAGFGMLGALEEFAENEIRDQFETNVFGALWAMQEVLPYMRCRRSGHIINISSVAGYVGYAGSSLYAASKHALEGFSKGLKREVEPFGIKVSVVNPGPFRTHFAGSSLKTSARTIEAYEDVHTRLDNLQSNIHGTQSGDPLKAAQAILKLIAMEEPPFTLPLGEWAYEEIPEQMNATLAEVEAFRHVGYATDYEEERTVTS